MAEKKAKQASVRVQVFERCREELGPATFDWVTRKLGHVGEPSPLADAEEEARRLFRRLDALLKKGRLLAERHPELKPDLVGRLRAPTVLWWRSLSFAPVTPWSDSGPELRSTRAKLAYQLAAAAGLNSERVRARYAALVSLAVGNWPERLPPTATISQIINEEAKLMRSALKIVGGRLAAARAQQDQIRGQSPA